MSIVNNIKNNRKEILTGEIGALLHDIGKLHPNFIKTQSLESIKGLPHHSRKLDDFIDSQLIDYLKQLKIKLGNDEKSVYDFIKYHHDASGILLELLEKCDRKDSADDKGVVRKKQHLDDTWISSPFGYPKEKIDLNCLQRRFNDLQDNLSGLFKNYISETMDIACFRKALITNLKTTFSHALGETRVPSNDVTLWDHSYSTASLFKSVLAAMICGTKPDPQDLKWRIFGICWNGLDFINMGRKIAEIQARSDIIENIKKKLKRKFEFEIPIGNAIYEDTNGIYFTFPDLADKSKDLAKECAEEALKKIIYDESENELWPFFTLSKASETLTIIADELKFASEKRKTPKMTPTLFVKGEEKDSFENPEFAIPVEGQDVCPTCRIRPKDEKEERCKVCEERRKGRLLQWFSSRQDTIWIDEVADINNRISLISLNFYLDKWFDGTMVGTIYSQSFEDWKKGTRYMSKKTQNILRDKTIKQIGNDKIDAFSIANWISNNPTATETKRLLECFMEDGGANNISADIKMDPNEILNCFFIQNPSPARLYRIWQETDEFFDLVIKEIKNKIYSNKWKRIKFSVDYSDLNSKLKPGKNIEKNTPYMIQIDNLKPQNLLVFYNENGKFYTIESLGKFKFKNKTEEEAVKEALKQGFKYLASEDEPDKNLLENAIESDKIKVEETFEEYYPLIEITKSPLSLRLMVPTLDSIKIIGLITKLYNKRFEKVLGKLPLNIKLLVSKRKFPLYVLLDAEERMLEEEKFKKQVPMNPWWDISGMKTDKYYGFYPIRPAEDGKRYTLDDLSSISAGKIFYLYPGYFDFELLLGTVDRYNIYYKDGKRGNENYKLFTGRPYCFYQVSEVLKLWDILSSNLSSRQINIIEELLTLKLREWRYVENGNKQNILRDFAEAVLRNVFGDKWNGLRGETKFFLVNSALNKLLLDTISLFKHVIKGVDNDE
jgi:CRISPR-associated Csx11 family protein